MLIEFSDIESRDPKRAEDLRFGIGQLLMHQVIWSGDHSSTRAYSALSLPQYRNFLTNYFDVAGFRFIHQAEEQWVGLVPDADAEGSWGRLPLDLTVTLLVLGVMWNEGFENGEAGARSVVRVTFNQFYDRYCQIVERNGRPTIEWREAVTLIRDVKRRRLIDIGEEDHEMSDFDVDIRPIILQLVSEGALSRLELFAQDIELDINRSDSGTDDTTDEEDDSPEDSDDNVEDTSGVQVDKGDHV
ncbi:DUF4194 domain-containing protein [Thalassospira xiamenensis]|uniref:DUF4194 domain-containing protein n=1 Tax=Thalassospira xiamenensis TaxID=220697 RepID=A0A285THE8_9PROT|nr:DUF4194 domain-containing protein [Thalassospira xiamenensis]SOC21472.1 protein of unknown function [Thalassospira xiamenensis]